MSASPHADQLARFAADPDDRAGFERLEEQLFMAADWPALADLYRRRRAAPSLAGQARARAQLALRLGQLYEERLDDEAAAIEAYTDAVRLDPALRRALQPLRRLYAARHSWGAVLQVCEQQAALAETGDERARIYAEMGDVWLRQLGDAEQAESLYERARVESGGARGDTAAPAESGSDAGAEALVQTAWLAAARGDTDAALAGLERALAQDPAHVEALDMMLTVLEGAERPEEMPRLLERRAALAADPETRSAVLLRLGGVREELGDLDDARTAYERAVEAHPEHSGARAALARVYRALEAWSPLRALLESVLETAEATRRVDALCELAALLESPLDEPEEARERYAQALAIDPDEPRARQALARLGAEPETSLTMPDLEVGPPTGEQRSTRVVGVLERKLAQCEARGERLDPDAVRLRLRIAELRGGALGDPAEAIEVLEPLLVGDATLLEAAPMLAGLYEQLGRMGQLIDLAERAAAVCPEAGSRAFWLRRAAEAARDAGEPLRAIESYRALLDAAPGDRRARAALCDLYRSRGEAAPLAVLLREELPRADESRELDLQLELASLLAESLGDSEGSIVHLRRAIELDPARGELLEWALHACGLCGGALAQLDLVDLAALRAPGDGARAALLARRGALLADALDWPEEAAESWRAALALDPEQRLARERLSA